MTTDDPELGRMRWCNGCQEWWPDDDEFWFPRVIPAGTVAISRGRSYVRHTDTEAPVCRACQYERRVRWYTRTFTVEERRRQWREAQRHRRQRAYDAHRSATAG